MRRRWRWLKNTAAPSVGDGASVGPADKNSGRPRPEPAVQSVGRRLPQGDLALLSALSPHRERPGAQRDIGQIEAAQLAHPQPAAVEHLEHRIVPQAAGEGLLGRRWGRRVQQYRQLGRGQHARQAAVPPGDRSERAGSSEHRARVMEPAEVTPQGRSLPGPAAGRVAASGEMGQVATQRDPVHLAGMVQAGPLHPGGETSEIRPVRSDGVR